MSSNRNSNFQISWMTISYRSVAVLVIVIVLLAVVGAYVLFPQWSPVQSTIQLANRLLQRAGLSDTTGSGAPSPGSQQAHFTNLDGAVKVKRANSNSWASADYSVPLEKGDVVQTSSEGMAKVVFSDGTSYTIKPDSLIVIEESSTNAGQQTQVAVQVTTGTVDLSTATYAQGSKSEVIVAGATASLAPESSAVVRNDPRRDEHEIMVKKGRGQVRRNNQTIVISDYEKVSFKSDSESMTRSKEIGPPTLIQPGNMISIFVPAGGQRPVEFAWTPAPNSRGYRLRVSKNPYFSSTVFDRVMPVTEAKVPGLREGTYYWMVLSLDANGRESVDSERNQFTLLAKSGEQVAIPLELEPFVQHGHTIEVKGKTDPLARVMVNGKEVPLILPDGSFHYFTPPLPRGENVITVTAQNARGGVRTQQKKIVIE